MKWRGRAGSTNIDDRRGRRMALPLGGGIGGLVLLLVISALTGQNPLDLVSPGGPGSDISTPPPSEDDPQRQFVAVVLRDLEGAWTEVFRERGQTYQPPVLVLFEEATESACGVGSAAIYFGECMRVHAKACLPATRRLDATQSEWLDNFHL